MIEFIKKFLLVFIFLVVILFFILIAFQLFG